MPDTYTTSLGLVKPEVGSSRDTWGTKTNGNWDALDQLVSMASPIGKVDDFAGPNAPSGWLICDGRLISRTTYSDLFAVIGVYWGAGDGSTTFALPGPQGRASIGPGTVTDAAGGSYSYSFTQKTGAVTVVIAKVNLPNYGMASDVQGAHVHNVWTGNAGGHNHTTDAQGYHSHGDWTANQDRDHIHSGYTDAQGQHSHTAQLGWGYMNNPGGANLPAGTTQGTGNTFTDNAAGAHTHNVGTYGSSQGHLHQIYGDGTHGHNISWVGDHAHGAAMDSQGSHAHTVYLGGSGTAMSMLNPVIVFTKIIFAGKQAATAPAADAATSPVGLLDQMEATDDIAAIRQELAELRAILAPPRTGRLLQSPSRGPH